MATMGGTNAQKVPAINVFLQTKKSWTRLRLFMTVCVRAMPEGLTALRICDSPQDIFLRPRYTGPEKPIPFGGVPFCTIAIPVAFDGATDVSRASIMPCSIALIINRFIVLSRLNKNLTENLSHSLDSRCSSLLCTVEDDKAP